MKSYDITKLIAELKGSDNLRYRNCVGCFRGVATGKIYIRKK